MHLLRVSLPNVCKHSNAFRLYTTGRCEQANHTVYVQPSEPTAIALTRDQENLPTHLSVKSSHLPTSLTRASTLTRLSMACEWAPQRTRTSYPGHQPPSSSTCPTRRSPPLSQRQRLRCTPRDERLSRTSCWATSALNEWTVSSSWRAHCPREVSSILLHSG